MNVLCWLLMLLLLLLGMGMLLKTNGLIDACRRKHEDDHNNREDTSSSSPHFPLSLTLFKPLSCFKL